MRFGKLKMFFFLNGFIAIMLFFYFGSWLVSSTTIATIIPPYNANTIHVQYQVKGKIYTGSYLRNEIPFSQKQVSIHYFLFNASLSRVNSYMGLYAEPLAWWLVFLLASSMLLLMPNTVFSKGTIFQLQKKFPWLLMDEYFPAPPAEAYWNKEKKNTSRKKMAGKLEQNNDPRTLIP